MKWTATLSAVSGDLVFASSSLSNDSPETDLQVKDNISFSAIQTVEIKAKIKVDNQIDLEKTHSVQQIPLRIKVNRTAATNDDVLIVTPATATNPTKNPKGQIQIDAPDFANHTFSLSASNIDFSTSSGISSSGEIDMEAKDSLSLTAKTTESITITGASTAGSSFTLNHEVDLLPLALKVDKAQLTLLEENTLEIDGAN